MTDIFEAIAAPARRAILDELTERDGQTLFELCTRLTMRHGLSLSRQAISQHLDVMESAGLVTTRREGKYKFHHLDTSPLETIVHRWLTSKPQQQQKQQQKQQPKQQPKQQQPEKKPKKKPTRKGPQP